MPDDQRSARGQSRGGRLGFVVTACLASAALVTPIAIGATGSPLREGVRNPVSGSATRESLIIARTAANVYGTRQSNVGAGGAAIYGCRTTEDLGALGDTVKSTPCLRVNNLSTGLIFAYRFARGSVGGIYQAGPTAANDPRARPFITNATGIATGLNASRVDSLDADDIIEAIRATGPGAQGPKGPTGDKGATGPAGPPGIAGERGQWFSGANAPTPDLAGTAARRLLPRPRGPRSRQRLHQDGLQHLGQPEAGRAAEHRRTRREPPPTSRHRRTRCTSTRSSRTTATRTRTAIDAVGSRSSGPWCRSARRRNVALSPLSPASGRPRGDRTTSSADAVRRRAGPNDNRGAQWAPRSVLRISCLRPAS